MPAIENNLTQGSVTRKLIRYALPLMASSLLQAVYSITDIIIAGHFIGETGISAINTSSVIMNMLTQIAIGLTVGGNILVGQYYGAGKHEQRKQASGNMLTVGLIAGILMMAILLLLSRPFLVLLNAPAMEESVAYLRICCLGLLSSLATALSAILRGVGNSRIPLYCIIVSVSLNVVLDILLVAVFRMGVAGAALATVIGQGGVLPDRSDLLPDPSGRAGPPAPLSAAGPGDGPQHPAPGLSHCPPVDHCQRILAGGAHPGEPLRGGRVRGQRCVQ